VVKITNLSGENQRNALYTTVAFSVKYSGWNFGVSQVQRSIDATADTIKSKDKQIQVFAGYRFSNNFTLDFTRSALKENGSKAALAGFTASYLYEF